jgi:hypothetical protein
LGGRDRDGLGGGFREVSLENDVSIFRGARNSIEPLVEFDKIQQVTWEDAGEQLGVI